MELSVKDRLYLPAIFAAEGSFAEFNLKKSIQAKIAISEEESKTLNLRREEGDGGSIVWDTAAETALIADFTEEEKKYLKSRCEAVSEQSLHDDLWVLVGKIYDSI